MDLNDLAMMGEFPVDIQSGARVVSDGEQSFLPDSTVEAHLDAARRWIDGNTRGAPLSVPGNIEICLKFDPRQHGRFQYCEFTHRLLCDGKELTDIQETELSIWLYKIYKLRVSDDAVSKIIHLVAKRDHSFHPVQDWLNGLIWDQTPRLNGLLGQYFSMENAAPIYEEISKKWLVSSVARLMKPGSKVDTVVILAGNQGIGKSQGLQALVPNPEWYSDAAIDLHSKDALLAIHSGLVLLEFSELSDFNRKEASKIKAFISATKDRFRLPYARNLVEYQRQLIFTGSTNRFGFLNDKSGSRRFWPAKIDSVDLPAIIEDRDQLWAEALHLYRSGYQWWLDAKQQDEFDKIAASFQENDSWDDLIAQWHQNQPPGRTFTTADVFTEALEMTASNIHRGQEMRMGAILQSHGFKRVGRKRFGGKRVMVWCM